MLLSTNLLFLIVGLFSKNTFLNSTFRPDSLSIILLCGSSNPKLVTTVKLVLKFCSGQLAITPPVKKSDFL